MYFLNPGAFWAFFLILIPVLIHLFNLRRVKKIYFSNLRFLKDVAQQQKSRSTLKKWLVLISRILALSFLVLAFAQPIMPDDVSEQRINSPVIYIDNSLSLQRTDLSGNLLLINAITATKSMLDALPKGLDIALLTNDRNHLKWEQVTSVTEKVQNLDYAHRPVEMSIISDRAIEAGVQETIIISDFQKSTSGTLEYFLEDTSTSYSLYKLYSPVDKNLFVDTVYLDQPLNLSTANTLKFVIKNTDTAPVEDVLIKVFKESLQLASFTVNLSPNSKKELSLDLANNEVSGGYRIEVEDAPLVFDNIFYFAINSTPKPLVVILSDGPVDPFLEKVYANNKYFQLVKNQIGNASFQKINQADLIALDHLEELPDWLTGQISQFNGNLLIVPGENSVSDNYSGLLGFTLNAKSTHTGSLQPSTLDHPFFEGFFQRKNERMDLPDVTISFTPNGYYETLLKTKNGDPYLIRNGRNHLFTGSFKSKGNNFPKHALYVPVMYRLAQRIDQERLYYRMNENYLVVDLDSALSESILELKNENEAYLPVVRYTNKKLLVEVPSVIETPGIYYLMTDTDTLRTVGINYSKTESEVATYSTEELTQLFSGTEHVKISEISDVQDFVKAGSSAKDQNSLWKYALFLALMFILAETILLKYIS